MSTESFDRKVSKPVDNGGFRPQLFNVESGSYAKNNVYGSGSAVKNLYTDQQLGTPDSQAVIRQHDTDVDFSLDVTLDVTGPDPGYDSTDELRIRTQQPLSAENANRYRNGLPMPSSKFGLPLFLDVQVVDKATGFAPPSFPAQVTPGQLQARLLYGGELALVATDFTTAPPTVNALVHSDFLNLWNSAAGTDQVVISVRGTYRGAN